MVPFRVEQKRITDIWISFRIHCDRLWFVIIIYWSILFLFIANSREKKFHFEWGRNINDWEIDCTLSLALARARSNQSGLAEIERSTISSFVVVVVIVVPFLCACVCRSGRGSAVLILFFIYVFFAQFFLLLSLSSLKFCKIDKNSIRVLLLPVHTSYSSHL